MFFPLFFDKLFYFCVVEDVISNHLMRRKKFFILKIKEKKKMKLSLCVLFESSKIKQTTPCVLGKFFLREVVTFDFTFAYI